MAVSVVKYPQGHIVDTNAVTATVSSSSGHCLLKWLTGYLPGVDLCLFLIRSSKRLLVCFKGRREYIQNQGIRHGFGC